MKDDYDESVQEKIDFFLGGGGEFLAFLEHKLIFLKFFYHIFNIKIIRDQKLRVPKWTL